MWLDVVHNHKVTRAGSEIILCAKPSHRDLHTTIIAATQPRLAIASHSNMGSIVYIMRPSHPSILHHPNIQSSKPSQLLTAHTRIRSTLASSYCLNRNALLNNHLF